MSVPTAIRDRAFGAPRNDGREFFSSLLEHVELMSSRRDRLFSRSFPRKRESICLRGRYAVLLAAKDHRLAACVAYYPSIRVPKAANQTLDAIALAADIRCPVKLIHGAADEVFVHAVFLQLREVLERRKAATMVQVHPGAVHSFMRPNLHANPANAAAARLSWPPVVGFLRACLEKTAAAVPGPA
jgi:hypothetical protein